MGGEHGKSRTGVATAVDASIFLLSKAGQSSDRQLEIYYGPKAKKQQEWRVVEHAACYFRTCAVTIVAARTE